MIKQTQDLKIKSQSNDIDLTNLILERKAVRQMVQQHGALWFILYELFILDDSISIQEFKRMFLFTVFIGLPLFLTVVYTFLIIITILGDVN